MASFAINFFPIKIFDLVHCITVPLFHSNRSRGRWDLRHRLKFSMAAILEMAAILKIIKVDCTLLSHPPHPQKFSFGLVEGFNPWSNYANPTTCTDVFWNNGAILKIAAILKLSKITKNVNDNYPLQSGHKITTTDQVSLRNEVYNFFLHHVMKEKSDGQLHQCAKRIDDKLDVRFFLHNVMKKKIISFISYHLIILFLNDKTHIF
jgi:hypothetical protein